MSKDVDPRDTDLHAWFPLFPQQEFEANLNQGWPIGILLDYPVELRERLSAASVSYATGYSSIDKLLRKYGGNYEFDPGGELRKDRLIKHECIASLSAFTEAMKVYRQDVPDSGTIGEFLSDTTIGSMPYSMTRAFAEADKGALYEALVIARMVLEQLCWALKIRKFDDPSQIKGTSATKSITPIAKIHPRLGQINGWLSVHAHWGYDAHIKAAFDDPGKIMMASCRFKACAYVALGVLSFEIRKVLSSEISSEIDSETLHRLDQERGHDKAISAKRAVVETARVVGEFYPDLSNIFRE